MNYRNKTRSNNKSKLYIFIAVVFALLLVGGIYYYSTAKNVDTSDNSSTADSKEQINLNPPTEDELNETQQFKKNLADNQQDLSSSNNTQDGIKQVTPIIGFLQQSVNGNIEANGYISGVIEADGVCTLTLEKDGIKVTESRKAMPDAQSTICGQLVINRDKLSVGNWKASISYASKTHKGVSEERQIDVK